MSLSQAELSPAADAPSAIAGGGVGDYLALLKPRVMSLVVFTALVGMVVAPGHLNPLLAAIALLAIAVGAGASGALNMWYDADIDARMQRTAARPIPRGRVTAEEALGLGLALSILSVMTLGLAVNWLAAALLAGTIAFYILVYTMWLKRSTPQNIVIGGAAGALPPVIGWASVTGDMTLDGGLLFAIIFLWTPPHFWALALYRCRDYERVGVPMLPVVAGPDATRGQILLYSLVLVPVAVLPSLVGLGGVAYAAAAVVLGGVFLWLAVAVYRCRRGGEADRKAKRLFLFSIFYLFALFAVLLLERIASALAGVW